MSSARPTECHTGDEALARGAWAEARVAFEGVLRIREIPEALEGLGSAAWWLDLADLVFDTRERAYRLYIAREDRAAAARVAVWLAWDYVAFRGENVVAGGWLQRARRLLEGQPACSERAWLEVREGSVCLFEDGDPIRAHALATEGIRIAREVGDTDLEMLGRSIQGLALVATGDVAEGMRGLDEVNAAVIGGELKDPVAIGLSSCYMLSACERVRDYQRASQWCTRLSAFCEEWGLRPLFAVCRAQYASICLWRGRFFEAEQELLTACDELTASRPAMVGDARARLAEVRRRQGNVVEAAALFDQTPPHGAGLLGRAELAFDRGDLRSAADQCSRYLRHTPPQNRTERAAGLELLIRTLAAQGDLEQAKTALVELSGIASLFSTFPLRAAASFAKGCIAREDGESDAARQHFEDAVDLFLQSGAPFEVARSRVELARVLGELGRTDAAIEEARSAIGLLSELKAEAELSRARRVLQTLGEMPGEPTSRTAGDHKLTRREVEVLRLVAEGLNNQAIAERLFLSDHTVHRHVANILGKLRVSTRAAAVAHAAREGLLISVT